MSDFEARLLKTATGRRRLIESRCAALRDALKASGCDAELQAAVTQQIEALQRLLLRLNDMPAETGEFY